MNDQATSPGCPDLEMISAVFDGEHKPDESVRTHLGSCPDCVRRLADYETIRGALSRAVASEPDPGMNARIAAYVRAESAGLPPVAPRERDFSDSRTAWIFRIAALFILRFAHIVPHIVSLTSKQPFAAPIVPPRPHTRRRTLPLLPRRTPPRHMVDAAPCADLDTDCARRRHRRGRAFTLA